MFCRLSKYAKMLGFLVNKAFGQLELAVFFGHSNV